MTGTAPAGVAVLTACAVVLVWICRLWPGPSGTHRRAGSAEVTVEMPLAEQAWRTCRPCGGVTAVVLHGSTAQSCNRGHLTITTTKGDRLCPN